jgi:hypothetical protein
MKIDYSSFERVEEFKYLGTIFTNHNALKKEIKSRLQAGNSSYHSVQNLLSASLLFKNLSIKIYIIIILPVVMYECETRSLKLSEERKLRVYKNRVLRTIFGLKREGVTMEVDKTT